MRRTISRAHADDRGINFVKILMFAGLVVGVYLAWVYVPIWLDNFAIKAAVRTGCAQAYAQRSEEVVKAAIFNGFKERAIQNEEIALDGSIIKKPLKVDNQNVKVTFATMPPSVTVELQYERKIVLPILKKPRLLRYNIVHTEDLSVIKY